MGCYFVPLARFHYIFNRQGTGEQPNLQDPQRKPKNESLVKKTWLNYDYMMFSIEKYTEKQPKLTSDVIRRKVMKVYYDAIVTKMADYDELIEKLNQSIDPSENEKMPKIRLVVNTFRVHLISFIYIFLGYFRNSVSTITSETEYAELMNYYESIYKGNLSSPGWEVEENHKNALASNIQILPNFPTLPLPAECKQPFERLYKKKKPQQKVYSALYTSHSVLLEINEKD